MKWITFKTVVLVLVTTMAWAKTDAEKSYRKISEVASKVNTISSEFIQEKHLQMMREALVSRGYFYFLKPDRLRWELVEPSAFGFTVNGDKASRWRGRKGRTQSFNINREPVFKVIVDQVFAWANADFKKMSKGYDISVVTQKPLKLKLVPRFKRERKILDHILLEFSGDGSYVRIVEVHEKGRDFTRIRFINPVINQPIAPDLF